MRRTHRTTIKRKMGHSEDELEHLEINDDEDDSSCNLNGMESDVKLSKESTSSKTRYSSRNGISTTTRTEKSSSSGGGCWWECLKGISIVLCMGLMIFVIADDYRLRQNNSIGNNTELPNIFEHPQEESQAASSWSTTSTTSSSSTGGDTAATLNDVVGSSSNSLNSASTKEVSSLSSSSSSRAPSSPLLPKRIYSVIGLEDSGTQFVSRLIRDALKIPQYREGSFPYHRNSKSWGNKGGHHSSTTEENAEVQVQHFSLPWGSTCQSNPNPPVVDVVLPSQCTRTQVTPLEIKECQAMVKSIWGYDKKDRMAIKYPSRYQLDIVSHKAWYDAQGVEQYIVIVVRDQKISFTARAKHCSIPELRQEEENVGTDLIVDAINTFILKDGNKNVTRDTYQYWAARQFQKEHGRRKLSALSLGNNVVVVSYESLVKLGPTYVKMLYEVLDIESDYFPEILNSNAKYVMEDTTNEHSSANGGNR